MDTRNSTITTTPLKVLMLPWLAHGHLSPFLELAKKLSERNFHVYFCSTPVNLASIKSKLGESYNSFSIQLVELHLPSLPQLPPHYHTTNGLPPHLMPALKTAFDMATQSFAHICNNLNPDLLIYDFLQPWAPQVAFSVGDIPAVEFLTTGAGMTSFTTHFLRKTGVEFPYRNIYVRDYEKSSFDRLMESSANGLKDRDRILQCMENSSKVILIRTFREIEAKYIDYLSNLTEKKMLPVGPLVVDDPDEAEEKEREIVEWLNKKDESSVLFVSFGSEYFLSKEDMEEIAHGLEIGKVDFIWVVRFPMGEKNSVGEELPEKFIERVGDRGMVVEGWAPQKKILRHSSIGGFVSHCGWSSVIESMKFGVPIIAMPMHLDQPINAKVVEEVGVGLEIERDENGQIKREGIAKVIREVVLEKSGEHVRRRVREMSEKMRRKGDEEISSVVEELLQLCHKRD